MNKEELCYMPAFEMREKIKTQELSSLEITEIIIERIEKINPIINAYCTPTFDYAREMAENADKMVKNGEKLGLLHGLPTSIKDLIITKDIKTTYGCVIFEDNIPDQDEVVVKRLKEAGIVLLGKTNTPAFGHQAVTDNEIFGKTKNPWNLERTSGGSSGGAAASVAAGLGPLAIGSDGGGSIRIPSCFCGLYGLKPSFGRIPHYPKLGLNFITLSHYGPIVRYVKDAALMLDAMKGPHESDQHSLPEENINYFEVVDDKPKDLSIAYSLDLGFVKAINTEVEEAILSAVGKFEQFGWTVEEAEIDLKKPHMAFSTLVTAGLAHDFESYLDEWADKMTPNLVRLIRAGTTYSAIDLLRARMLRKAMYEQVSKLFQKFDILITPTTAVFAFELGKMFPNKIGGRRASPTAWMSFTFPFNMTWNPAATIPCGWSSENTPIGMQIVGRRYDEKTVLQVSKAFEEIAPWQDKKPNL
ncbi:MAG: amidase [Promethearchaeota archaeon]|nr:MAG: amidase [Candidatus Lokiarchaeota archaeon]